MLRSKLFRGFALLVVIFGVLSGYFGVRVIRSRIYEEAQTRVNYDLGTAWSILNSRRHELETVLRMAAGKKLVVEDAQKGDWKNEELRNRLELIRVNMGLDFLGIVSPDRKVLLRTTAPYKTGDFRIADPAIAEAMGGEAASCIGVFSKQELETESEELAERAYLVLEETSRARPTLKTDESRGMVLYGAAPIREGTELLGVLYGGILLNRNIEFVDRVKNIIYKDAEYRGKQIGTVTIFLHDARIATTVRLPNGNRALGTRVSKEVADSVLDNGRPWIDRAFVVNDWYLSAYDPIRDCRGRVVGMLYVGILERPYSDMSRNLILRYVVLCAFALAFALVLAFVIANRLSQPIHRLVEASNRMRHGENPPPVPCDGACQETESLIRAFNQMADVLAERQARLTEANQQLEGANKNLITLNRSYMETLGFVAHELKSPLASIMNYVYLLDQEMVGPLTDKQKKAVRNIDTNLKRIVEMVRHYLNLSRIENQEVQPVRTRVAVNADVLKPIVESYEGDLEARGMRVENRVPEDLLIHADLNMTREVFENLVSNAIKYGRENSAISVTAEPAGEMVRFAVRNEGEGVAPDSIGQLFQKFSRLEHEQTTRRQKGTGLGLFITKHIVEAHGGTIEAVSEYHKWIEFRFTLPGFKEEERLQS